MNFPQDTFMSEQARKEFDQHHSNFQTPWINPYSTPSQQMTPLTTSGASSPSSSDTTGFSPAHLSSPSHMSPSPYHQIPAPSNYYPQSTRNYSSTSPTYSPNSPSYSPISPRYPSSDPINIYGSK
ncbi:unnamed protein product [Rotaria sordida]|uniref:Uncharacterized protein n=2 Tax=Rotaria sordida TaxID=392033 RepID=A0A815G1U0_9BILA|nr:unnamed protein product [Rotaria sordida]CAF1592629.1 unnamed protein product [Rotaria sordida]